MTLDLNYDNSERSDSLSHERQRPKDSGTKGLVGLLDRDSNVAAANEFGIRDTVAVWSLGPDGKYAVSIKANKSDVAGGRKGGQTVTTLLSWQ